MASTCSWITALLTVLCLSAPSGEAVKCYLCSWSEHEMNLTDYCLKNNLRTDVIGLIDCEHGCEIGAELSKTGQMKHFFRNCANSKAKNVLECQNFAYKDLVRETCSCNWDLCNGTPSLRNGSAWMFAILASCLLGLLLCST